MASLIATGVRAAVVGAFLIQSGVLRAQHPATHTPASIRAGLEGCWYGGDGSTEGRYCFTGDKLTITPNGSGRQVFEREWSVDAKGNILVRSGRHRIVYVVERLATDGFVLVNDKEHVRLEGHREPPKKR